MYLSKLEIDTSRRPGRLWLSNPHRVHQRLLMAFRDAPAGRVLYRIERLTRPPHILVQASCPAEWDAAFADHPVLASPPRQKEVRLEFSEGQRLRFLLRANPTKRLPSGRPGEKVDGKRVALYREEAQRAWLIRKGTRGGFRPLAFDVRPLGDSMSHKGPMKEGAALTHVAVEFEGILEVTDPQLFQSSLSDGIGPGKAYGFGLLSLASPVGWDSREDTGLTG